MSAAHQITAAQRNQFWRFLSDACQALGLSEKDEKEAYRKSVLKGEGGVEHLADLDRTSGYDKVMAHFASDAGNYEAACKFLASVAGRVINVIHVKAAQLAGETMWKEYVRGIQQRAGFGERRLEDLTDHELRALIAILDTQLRRSARRVRA